MQTSSQWNVLIGLFYFHFNKMSPPLLFSSPPLLLCPLHFSQAALSDIWHVGSLPLLPVNGSFNSTIWSCKVCEEIKMSVCECESLCATGCSRTRLTQEVERGGDGKMKGETWKEMGRREKSWDFMNTTSRALATEMRCASDQKPLQTDITKTVIHSYSE